MTNNPEPTESNPENKEELITSVPGFPPRPGPQPTPFGDYPGRSYGFPGTYPGDRPGPSFPAYYPGATPPPVSNTPPSTDDAPRPYGPGSYPGLGTPYGPPAFGFPPPPAPDTEKDADSRSDNKSEEAYLSKLESTMRDILTKHDGKKLAEQKEDFRNLVLFTAASVPLAIFDTYVMKWLFNWFVPSVFPKVKPINGAQATGLSLAAAAILPKPHIKLSNRGERPDRKKLIRILKVRFSILSGLLIVGRIAKAFLPKR